MKQREVYLLQVRFRHKGVFMFNGDFKAFNTNNWVHVWHNDKLIAEDVRTVAELKKALDPFLQKK